MFCFEIDEEGREEGWTFGQASVYDILRQTMRMGIEADTDIEI